jgi:protein SCO1/2
MKQLIIGIISTILINTNIYAQDSDVSFGKEEDTISSSLIKTNSEYKMVFFGYAGCYHFCDPRLKQLDPIYNALKSKRDIKVLFIDISNETTLDAVKSFIKETNSEFEFINPDNRNLKILQRKFEDVYIQKLPDGEYLHSGFLYLLKRQQDEYQLLKIYVDFRNTDVVVKDILRLTNK